jgi:hypothetical protein
MAGSVKQKMGIPGWFLCVKKDRGTVEVGTDYFE